MLKGCQVVFYVWGFKQAFSLQKVSEARLDQHIWEPAQEDADNIWISEALHTKICLNTEEKYNVETQQPKIQNGKVEWQAVRAFSSFCTVCCLLSPLLCSNSNGEWQDAENLRRTTTVQKRKWGEWGRGWAGGEGRLLQTPVFGTANISVEQSPRDGQLLLSLSSWITSFCILL